MRGHSKGSAIEIAMAHKNKKLLEADTLRDRDENKEKRMLNTHHDKKSSSSGRMSPSVSSCFYSSSCLFVETPRHLVLLAVVKPSSQ